MEAMDGPVNFGETDKYWGLLVNGFTHPSLMSPITLLIQGSFESYGFQVYYKMEGFTLTLQSLCPKDYQELPTVFLRNRV